MVSRGQFRRAIAGCPTVPRTVSPWPTAAVFCRRRRFSQNSAASTPVPGVFLQLMPRPAGLSHTPGSGKYAGVKPGTEEKTMEWNPLLTLIAAECVSCGSTAEAVNKDRLLLGDRDSVCCHSIPRALNVCGSTGSHCEKTPEGARLLEAAGEGTKMADHFSPKVRPAFPSSVIISERSSPSRVRCAAPNNGAPLTACGPFQNNTLRGGKGSLQTARWAGDHFAAILVPFFSATDTRL
jgi:hypothetical protein